MSMNQYYREKCEKWISNSNKSKHDNTNKHQVIINQNNYFIIF